MREEARSLIGPGAWLACTVVGVSVGTVATFSGGLLWVHGRLALGWALCFPTLPIVETLGLSDWFAFFIQGGWWSVVALAFYAAFLRGGGRKLWELTPAQRDTVVALRGASDLLTWAHGHFRHS